MLQILTSDFDACPAYILAWLKSRWREENFLKYASENYGIDKICDYIASIETNTKITDNPARKKANAAVHEAEKAPRSRRTRPVRLLADPPIAPAAKNTKLIPTAQKIYHLSQEKLEAAAAPATRSPRNCPPTVIYPFCLCRAAATFRRGLQMVLRLLAHNAEHWLSGHLNAYLRDDDEYRAITRQTIIRALAFTITYTQQAITVELQQPDAPRVTRALALLINEINSHPARNARRPATHHLMHVAGHRPPGSMRRRAASLAGRLPSMSAATCTLPPRQR